MHETMLPYNAIWFLSKNKDNKLYIYTHTHIYMCVCMTMVEGHTHIYMCVCMTMVEGCQGTVEVVARGSTT
jgi:hypothetical protein